MGDRPPVAKYRLEVVITGNTMEEVQSELGFLAHGGYMLSSEYLKSDEFQSTSGRVTTTQTMPNPGMTAERYTAELDAWFKLRRAAHNASVAEADKKKTPPICPECQQGKPQNCDGRAWDAVADDYTPCQGGSL